MASGPAPRGHPGMTCLPWGVFHALDNAQARCRTISCEEKGYAMRSPWIIPTIVAIGLSVGPASAQQVDQSTRQQIERKVAAEAEYFEKHDAAGIAGLYTTGGVLVTQNAVKTGRHELEKHYIQLFKLGLNHEQARIEQVLPLGPNAVIVIGEYHVTGQGKNGPIKRGGHWTAVDVREGDIWKTRLTTAVPNPLAAESGDVVKSSRSAR